MKRILVVILVLSGVLIGGHYLMTGRLPWVALSDEEQQVVALREEFDRIRQQWRQAGQTQALGVDASSQSDSIPDRLEQLDRTLAELTPRFKTYEAKNQATTLRREIATFKSEMR
ncbi:MAG TPA: hypothetical protein VGK03_12415 [Geothrix sp.]